MGATTRFMNTNTSSTGQSKGIPRYPEDRRETWLTAEQVEDLLTALDNYSDQSAANAIRLLIVTGAREGEVLSATWDQFDIKRGIWTKPSHHTKENRTVHVPLSEAAMIVLRQVMERGDGLYLFPGAKPGTAPRPRPDRSRLPLQRRPLRP